MRRLRSVPTDPDPIEQAAQRIADEWPPLTEEQLLRISMLLRPSDTTQSEPTPQAA